jgi:hypothetical protein
MLGAALGFWLVPPAMLLLAALDVTPGRLTGAAAVATGLSAAFWMLLSYGMRIPVGYGLLYPVGALMALFIAARSTWRGGRRVEWRGRTYGETPSS